MEKEIIEKASYLFLKYGYKSVTMDDLAEHMRISKKTIYDGSPWMDTNEIFNIFELPNLIKKLENRNFKNATLGGCIFFVKKDKLCVKKEQKI